MRSATILALLSLLVTRAADGAPSFTYVEYASSPAPGARAPLNAHVWLTLDRYWEKRGFCKIAEADHLRCVAGDYALALRRAGGVHATADDVPFDRRDAVADNEMTVELVPRAPLAPQTRYEVWQIDRHAVQPDRILMTFKTGTTADTTPPRWDDVVVRAYAPPKGAKRSGTGEPPMAFALDAEWETASGPAIELEGDEAVDDETPAAQILLGVWVADAGARVDYTKPPQVWLRQPAPTSTARDARGPMKLAIRLGGSGDEGCGRANWEGPPGRAAGPFTLGLRAVDAAGNMSPPREAAVGARPAPRRK